VFLGGIFQLSCSDTFHRLAKIAYTLSQTDRQTDRRHHDASSRLRWVQQCDRLKVKEFVDAWK